MDSNNNSGSMQSSSGGDEEYDSRAESIAPFMMNPSGSSAHFGSTMNSHQLSNLFDPSSHSFGDFSHTQQQQNPNANSGLYNLNPVWSRGLISSDPNPTTMGLLLPPFPISSSARPVADLHGGGRATPPPPPPPSDHDQQQQTPPQMTKNSKKRTRASRRAPTTVLTTDTSNFRQMVQEFTGFPAPPFSASPYSRRLDLFATGSAMRSGQMEPLGPLYPLRPQVQKPPQLSPFVSSSSSSPSLMNTTRIDSMPPNTTNINTLINSENYQRPSDHHHHHQLGLDQPQNMLNMQNQMLTFQSLLRSPLNPPTLRYPSTDSVAFGSTSQRNDPNIPSIDDLGGSHENVNANLGGFQGQGSSEAATTRRIRSDNDAGLWRDRATSNDRARENLGSFD